MDLFIIVMSSSLAVRFRQITERLEAEKEKIINAPVKSSSPEFIYPVRELPAKYTDNYIFFLTTQACSFFKEIREDYNRLAYLCQHLDRVLSNLIVVSYTTNLSFILVQLFNSLRYLLQEKIN